MSNPIPVTIVSGFLGSGKTTLLNEVLRGDHGLRVAVIVNEFGAVGIDGQLVQGGEEFIEMANGCICCALNQELEVFLRKLMENKTFDHVILETTGLADPLPVAWTFARQGLEEFYRIDALITVVDAKNLSDSLKEHEMAAVQIERADLLVLNKCDLVSDAGEDAVALIRSKNEHAPVFRTQHASVGWDLLLGGDRVQKPLDRSETPHVHERYTTWTFQSDDLFDDEALEDWLYDIPDSVFRVKGLVRSNYGTGWRLINGVSGRIDFRPFEPKGDPEGAIVFIGADLPIEDLEKACNELLV
jgi:G3E family GTPase